MILRYLAKQGQGHQISKVDKNYDGKFSSIVPKGKEIGVEIDFSGATPADPNETFSLPHSFHKEGFSILCGACNQYINIVFDEDMSIGTGTMSISATDKERKDYTIGIGGATTLDDLARALFEGIANSAGRDTKNDVYVTYGDGSKELVCVSIDPHHNVRIAKNPNYSDDPTVAGSSPNKYIFIKEYSTNLDFYDGGKTVLDENGNPVPHIETITVDTETEINIWEPTIGDVTVNVNNPLVIHDGTQAGQRNHYSLKNMQIKALTAGDIFKSATKTAANLINVSDRARYDALSSDTDKQDAWLETLKAAAGKTVDDISVITQKDANVAIRILDGALEYSLDIVTNIGAYVERLEAAENVIVTKEENAAAAESTIRDADLARAMTNYTSTKIHSRAAQSILAHSNQDSSNVLTLLK